MRTIEFKMEQEGLVKKGDEVQIIEREGASGYSYIIDPAVAMSGCYQPRDRIKNQRGVVKEVRHNDRGYYVIAEFEE